MRDCVGKFTVCWNLVQNKVAQQNTDSETWCSSASLRQKLKKKMQHEYVLFFLSLWLSICLQVVWQIMWDIYWCAISLLKRTFFFSLSLSLRWLCFHIVRDLINSLILEGHWLLITVASYKQSMNLLQHTHTRTHICCYGNTHLHLDSFSCSATWQKPSRLEWNNTLIRQEGHGVMGTAHKYTYCSAPNTWAGNF